MYKEQPPHSKNTFSNQKMATLERNKKKHSTTTTDSDRESCSTSSFAGTGSRRSSISIISSSPSASLYEHTNTIKPHKANQAEWEAMARVRRGGRPVGLEHFRLLRRVGSGDIGNVYLCQIRNCSAAAATGAVGGYYAMKVVDMEALAARKKMGRAEMEKEILGLIDHPFCPTLYASFTASHYSCLVMEYCPGGDLYAARQRLPGNRFSISSARFYAAETLLALEYLHMMGIVYRDLKPENLLIREDGHIMLSDFDLSFKCDVVPKLLNRDTDDPSHVSITRSLNDDVEEEDEEDGITNYRWCSTPRCTVTPLHPMITCFSPSFRRSGRKIVTTIRENADDECVESYSSGGPKRLSRSCSYSVGSMSRFSDHRRMSRDGGERCPEVVAEPINARSKSFVGTHEYLAPEVISGQGHGSAVDWWTFGIFLYEMLYGTTPFKGENNERTLVNILKKPLTFPKTPVNTSREHEEMVKAQDLITKLLSKNPKKRIGSLKGSVEIKRHEFFRGVNWALIRSVKPPFIPKEHKKNYNPNNNNNNNHNNNINIKINHGVNYYLPPKLVMSKKEREEPFKIPNHFEYF